MSKKKARSTTKSANKQKTFTIKVFYSGDYLISIPMKGRSPDDAIKNLQSKLGAGIGVHNAEVCHVGDHFDIGFVLDQDGKMHCVDEHYSKLLEAADVAS